MSALHVHELRVNNFKRVQAVTVAFPAGGGMVEIAGANGSGKSSTIDALFCAIAGKDAGPEEPIRRGTRSGRAEVDLGEYRVVREWDARGSRLTVTTADGAKVGGAQTLLDGLFSRLAFDPLEFSRMSPPAQAATLRRIAGLDFRDLDRRRAAAYAERTEVSRAVRAQEARAAEMPDVPETAEVSAETLKDELQRASRQNVAAAAARRALERAEDDVRRADADVARAEEALAAAQRRRAEARTAAEAARGQAEGIDEVDTAPILERITDIDRSNRLARQHRERRAALDEIRANQAHAGRLTDEIASIDAERAAMLGRARFPVDGLSVDGDGVTFGGVPFAQASTAEQIRVSLGIGAALNPRLRLVAIREGSLLDEASLRMVADWAAKHDCQVLVERVADAMIGPGVVIEEGLVKAGPPAQAPAPARVSEPLFP
jgi:hypothetical protein